MYQKQIMIANTITELSKFMHTASEEDLNKASVIVKSLTTGSLHIIDQEQVTTEGLLQCILRYETQNIFFI